MTGWLDLGETRDPSYLEPDWHEQDPGQVYDALGQILAAAERPAWHRQAACRGETEAFYPERGQSVREQKATCAGCPVREPCLDFAIVRGEKIGIWGGMSARERRAETKRRREAARRIAARRAA